MTTHVNTNENLPSVTPAGSMHKLNTTTHGQPNVSNADMVENIYTDAASFLREFHGDDNVFLVAFKEGFSPIAQAFRGSNRDAEIQKWVEFQNIDQQRSIYFYPACLRDDFSGVKASKSDVLSSDYAWLDFDPPKDVLGKEMGTWREKVIHEIKKQFPPSILVDSGRGLWAYWKLKDRIVFDGLGGTITKAFEAKGKSLELAFRHLGADNCHNIDRLARLPGTINHKTGRLAAVISCDPTRSYNLDDFPSVIEQPVAKAQQIRNAPPYDTMAGMLCFLKNGDHFTDYSRVVTDKARKIISIGWLETGMALKIAYADEGKSLWALTHDQTVSEEIAEKKWKSFSSVYEPGNITIGSIIKAAIDAGFYPKTSAGLTIADFHTYLPEHKYFCEPTGELWPAASINARLPYVTSWAHLDKEGSPTKIKPSIWLDVYQSVEQMIWAPGELRLIEDRLLVDGGWIDRGGVKVLNLYRPPCMVPGESSKADPWISHLQKVYPEDAGHIILWLAHRVQRPEQKINHALVLGGNQGVGKDSLLEPLKYAVGPWNFIEVSPKQVMGRFNGFLKSVILRISEGRDLGEVDRYAFYESMKTYIAAPPDILRVDEKNIREHSIFNVCGIIITTNHKTNGIYLPADDRRHYVAWSDLTKEDFTTEYWDNLWRWYESGGISHVAAYLRNLDITNFNPKSPPQKTEAFYSIVNANATPEDAELADVLEQMGGPDAVTIQTITDNLSSTAIFGDREDLYSWLTSRKNRRAIPHRMEQCGYIPIRNPSAQKGLWIIKDKRQVVYVRRELSKNEQIKVAADLAKTE